jgi:GNAT superfamily N-acetyltransferase
VDIRSLGFRTDIMLRILEGGECAGRGDYVVVRSPANPAFWWGNFLLLAKPPEPGGVSRWLSSFAAEFPAAGHVALGIDVTGGNAVDPAGFVAAGLHLTSDAVMTAAAVRLPPHLNHDAQFRPLAGPGDWQQAAELRIACNPGGPGFDSDFLDRRTATERRLAEEGHGSWFGAFSAGSLVAILGIFSDGSGIARFQNVETHPGFRGQGLARTLVYHAGRYGLDRLSARTLVIVAEPDSQAARVYGSVGFEVAEDQVSFERPPA